MIEKRFTALDLFCGLGGWSDGLSLEGFDCLGVEIEPKIAKIYGEKHDVICADVMTLNPVNFKDFDLIVGSPPCRDFTQMPDYHWVKPKNVVNGLELVNSFLNFVDQANPKYWLMENVKGLIDYVGKPRLITHLSYTDKGFLGMKRCFWGTYPGFLVFRGTTLRKERVSSPIQKWIRAKIPLLIAKGLGKACYSALS